MFAIINICLFMNSTINTKCEYQDLMRILFISISMPNLSLGKSDLYSDIMYCLSNMGHDITILAPSIEDDFSGKRKEGKIEVVRVPLKPFIGNIPFYKKGIRIMEMSKKYIAAYNKYIADEKFDIILMATPPSSLYDVVKLAKKRSGAKFYLILRDIHPECLDRKKIPERFAKRTDVYDECKRPYGVNFFVEKLLFYQSQSLYKLADWVGCMSPGNQRYFKTIAPYIDDDRIVLLPNWYKGREYSGCKSDKLLEKYNLKGKFIAIFGGTIGEAQAVWNIATLAKHNLEKKDVVFLIVGRGTKKGVLEDIAKKDNLTNIRFLNYLPREDYEQILELADLGLISIDEKYKVPTCPSKIIGYMALAKPVLAMFNEGSDYGEYYIDQTGCGLYSVDLNHKKMFENFDWFYSHPKERVLMGMAGYNYYKTHLTVEAVCNTLNNQIIK